ncbi:hypothetical protein [Streptomyces adustus]|uniref:hypothetical protein n=1 Tax=Streptomyces adustus TaxID=1609272 RepID=UPI0037195916
MAEFELDLHGADETRAEMIKGLEASGEVDGDVMVALSSPGVPDWLLSHPFQVVADLDDLNRSGSAAEVPERWRDGLPPRIEAGDRERLFSLYQRVLTEGTREDQRALVERQFLVDNWSALRREIHPTITSLWEQRFPGLRR